MPGITRGAPPVIVPAFATQIQDPTTKKWVLQDTWCPANATPVPSTLAMREQAIRLLPRVSVGAAPSKGVTLVNIETITWAATSAARDLGTVEIVGQQVHLRLTFDHAQWDYGDGSRDTRTTPGKPYSQPCGTPQCPQYEGHTYTTTNGPSGYRITLTVSWIAEFSLDGTHWSRVDPEPITGPASTARLVVKQARGVLLAPPAIR